MPWGYQLRVQRYGYLYHQTSFESTEIVSTSLVSLFKPLMYNLWRLEPQTYSRIDHIQNDRSKNINTASPDKSGMALGTQTAKCFLILTGFLSSLAFPVSINESCRFQAGNFIPDYFLFLLTPNSISLFCYPLWHNSKTGLALWATCWPCFRFV